MKLPSRILLAAATLLAASSASAADLSWDGTNIGGTGDGASSFLAGTWSTTNANWDQGNGLARVVWDNGTLNNAIFGGTSTAGTKTVTIGSNVTVDQIVINMGTLDTGAARYDIGASSTQNDFAISFGGTYSDTHVAIGGTAGQFGNSNFNAKITGTIAGGLVIKNDTDGTSGSVGRFALTNTNNDFVGDVVMLSGNLSATSSLGNAANKLVLKGGSLFVSGGTGTTTFVRDINVAGSSGINTNVTANGQILELTGAITGSSNLTRYSNTDSLTSTVVFEGDMSGYTGTFENKGNNVTIQTTATSQGGWKLTGGTVTLNATNNTNIADGVGKSDLLMAGGTLNMNGKDETINGLNGATGTVQNQLAATNSTLTLGGGDSTAGFGGTIRNNSGTGGTLAITKIGAGIQTLTGVNTYTGGTTVSAGTLVAASNTALGGGSVNVNTAGATLQIGSAGVTLGNGANLVVVDGATIKLGGLVAGALDGAGAVIALQGGTFNFNGSGQLDLGGVLNNLTAGVHSYKLISGAAVAGNTDFLFANITGYDASVSGLSYNNGLITFTAVPEPSTYGLIGAGALAAVAFVRRRRKLAGKVA